MFGLRANFGDVPAAKRLTLTWDQGSEMASHDRVADLFRDGVFAHAAKPWQRPTHENSNGLLRQYNTGVLKLALCILGAAFILCLAASRREPTSGRRPMRISVASRSDSTTGLARAWTGLRQRRCSQWR